VALETATATSTMDDANTLMALVFSMFRM